MSDDDFENSCPLCISPFSEQDRQLKPCKVCPFRLCLWCWHTIVTLAASDYAAGTCPQCRTPYERDAIAKQQVVMPKVRPSRRSHASRSHLADVVVQDNRVVAVRNLPASLFEQLLCRPSSSLDHPLTVDERLDALSQHVMFGQYGRIVGAVVVRQPVATSQHHESSSSSTIQATQQQQQQQNDASTYVYHAIVRFSSTEEASRAVKAVDGWRLFGVEVRCALVPSRYCSHYLMKTECTKKMCAELHREVMDRGLMVRHLSAKTLPVMGLAPNLFTVKSGGVDGAHSVARSQLHAGLREWVEMELAQALEAVHENGNACLLATPKDQTSTPDHPSPLQSIVENPSFGSPDDMQRASSSLDYTPIPTPSTLASAALELRVIAAVQAANTIATAERRRRGRSAKELTESSSVAGAQGPRLNDLLPPKAVLTYAPAVAGLCLPSTSQVALRTQQSVRQ